MQTPAAHHQPSTAPATPSVSSVSGPTARLRIVRDVDRLSPEQAIALAERHAGTTPAWWDVADRELRALGPLPGRQRRSMSERVLACRTAAVPLRCLACGAPGRAILLRCGDPLACAACRARWVVDWRCRVDAGLGAMRDAAPDGWHIAHVVLTVPHSGDARADASLLLAALPRLTRRLRSELPGSDAHDRPILYVAALQCTPGTDGHGHAHVHLAVTVPRDLETAVMAELWRAALLASSPSATVRARLLAAAPRISISPTDHLLAHELIRDPIPAAGGAAAAAWARCYRALTGRRLVRGARGVIPPRPTAPPAPPCPVDPAHGRCSRRGAVMSIVDLLIELATRWGASVADPILGDLGWTELYPVITARTRSERRRALARLSARASPEGLAEEVVRRVDLIAVATSPVRVA